MNAASTDKTIRLCDGRTLGFAEYGAPDGRALLYFHGHPGSRLEARFLEEQAVGAHVRLIGIDRPGMGLSTYKSKRRVLDWPDDVVELADGLGIERFAVVGFSGGGPYALACAHNIPQRLASCGIVSGAGHTGPVLTFLSTWLPWLLLPFARRRFFSDEKQAQETLTRVSQKWPEADKRSLDKSGVKELMAASLVEALHPGARGAAYDGMLLGRPWGFDLGGISLPSINLWHGELDDQVAVAQARAVAGALPRCDAAYYSDEGHISLIVNHGEEIVSSLIGETGRTAAASHLAGWSSQGEIRDTRTSTSL